MKNEIFELAEDKIDVINKSLEDIKFHTVISQEDLDKEDLELLSKTS